MKEHKTVFTINDPCRGLRPHSPAVGIRRIWKRCPRARRFVMSAAMQSLVLAPDEPPDNY